MDFEFEYCAIAEARGLMKCLSQCKECYEYENEIEPEKETEQKTSNPPYPPTGDLPVEQESPKDKGKKKPQHPQALKLVLSPSPKEKALESAGVQRSG